MGVIGDNVVCVYSVTTILLFDDQISNQKMFLHFMEELVGGECVGCGSR
jgi:hypothetical protein